MTSSQPLLVSVTGHWPLGGTAYWLPATAYWPLGGRVPLPHYARPVRASPHVLALPLTSLAMGFLDRSVLAHPGLEPPGVKCETQLTQLASDSEIFCIERGSRRHRRHVGHGTILAN